MNVRIKWSGRYEPVIWSEQMEYRRVEDGRLAMGGIEAGVAIFLLIAFIGGVVMGVVVIVSIASRREDRLFSLTGEAPDAMCRGARRFTGVWTRGDWPVDQVSGRRDHTRRLEAPR